MAETLAELDNLLLPDDDLVGDVGFQDFLASLSCWPEIRCRDGNLKWISVAHPTIPDVTCLNARMADVQLCMQFYGSDCWKISGAECREQWFYEDLLEMECYSAMTFMGVARTLQLPECLDVAMAVLDSLQCHRGPEDVEHESDLE